MKEQKNPLDVLGLPESHRKKENENSEDDSDLNALMKANMDSSKKFANSTKEQFEKLYKVSTVSKIQRGKVELGWKLNIIFLQIFLRLDRS